MKITNWICWLLAVCIYLSEAKSKIRRPLPSLYSNALMLKKPRPIGHRISMGNAIYIGGSFPHQRVPYKHVNYRIRRPTMYNVLPVGWKSQIPIRATLNNRAILSQRVPVKEFHSISKVPEYSPEYRPELVIMPATHRGSIDDDKGPIHTIPAPNLSPADKPYKSTEETANRRPYSSDLNYHTTVQNIIGMATTGSSLLPQRTATSSSPPQHQYEVTENDDATVLKEHQTTQSVTLQPQDLDITKLYSTIINPHLQSNELFVNHPVNANTGIVGSSVQLGQPSVPMQTNLHSSLHVGFPSAAIQTPYTVVQQVPELHVGHPAPAGPPLSATQLYDLLSNFPQKLEEQYAPDQQRVLQQQLGQIFQPDVVTSFSQPQMHSFNYDEQANQLQQQQQISLDQDYASDSVTTNYNLNPESSIDIIRKQNDNVHANEKFIYSTGGGGSGVEQSENNIEYEETNSQKSPTTYLKDIGDALSTTFYTTLPSREAAEKLAALAAAGNVNSRLIGQLRKQQEKKTQKDSPMPANHKNDNDININQERPDDNQQQRYNRHDSYHKSQQQYFKQNYKVQKDEKLPLQIMVLDENDYVTDDQQSDIKKDNVDMEYDNEYDESDDKKTEDSQSSILLDGRTTSRDNNFGNEFGTRLRSKIKE